MLIQLSSFTFWFHVLASYEHVSAIPHSDIFHDATQTSMDAIIDAFVVAPSRWNQRLQGTWLFICPMNYADHLHFGQWWFCHFPQDYQWRHDFPRDLLDEKELFATAISERMARCWVNCRTSIASLHAPEDLPRWSQYKMIFSLKAEAISYLFWIYGLPPCWRSWWRCYHANDG